MRKRPTKTDKEVSLNATRRGILRAGWLVPCGVAFLASFCVMVVELVAGRLIARHVGASLYTWTSVIGVVLTGLAAGHYLGGRLADRYRATRLLSVLLILASVLCMLSLPLNRAVGGWEALGSLSWPTRVALHVTLIFLWPAAALGTVAPVVAKMALDQGRQTGRTVGNVYAWGAVGSIIGTFLTGYWFIAAIGSTATIALVSGVLAMVGVAFSVHSWLSRGWMAGLILLALLLASPWRWARAATVDLGLREVRPDHVVYQTESAYSFIRVVEERDEPQLRSLTLDHLVHSWVRLGKPTELHYDYELLYAAVTHRLADRRKPIRTLFLGGGGYTFPRYVRRLWPDSLIEVAEIDPAVTRAAQASLGLDPNAGIRIHDLDARNLLDDLLRARGRPERVAGFDFVYGDAFNDCVIPFHLTTREFNEKLRQLMADDGVYLLNVIDAVASGRFLGAVVHTLRETFDHVWVFSTRTGLGGLDPDSRDTFVVVASPTDVGLTALAKPADQSEWPGVLIDAEQLARLEARSGGIILTDDYAPVEMLLGPVYGHDMLEECRKLNNVGLAFAMRRRYDRAAHFYRRALSLRPDFAEARSNLGWALYQQGQRERALTLFREAVEQDATLASAHNNLGWALHQDGRHAEAIEAFNRALRCNPGFALARNNLGLAMAARGELDSAIEAYWEAIARQPSFADAHHNLAGALAQLGQADPAIAAYRQALRLNPNHAEAHNDLGWLLHEKGQHAQAQDHLRMALRIDPEFIRAMDNLGRLLTATGELDKAVAVYAGLLKRQPGNVEACNHLGIALARQGKTDQAIRWFTEALKFQPDHGPSRDNLLATYLRTSRYGEAVSLLRSALKHTPDQPGVLSNLAWILATCPKAEIRNGAEAARLARQADELSAGRSPRVLDSLAAAHAELGQFDQAVAAARRAVALAKELGHRDLATAIAGRLASYQARKPFRHAR